MPSSPDSRQFAATRTAALLRKLEAQIHAALQAADADRVHDLRVAARRFSQALYIFDSSIPGAARMRRQLKPLIRAAGAVRDFDIAVKFLARDDAAGDARIVAQIEQRRAQAQSRLSHVLEKISGGEALARWRSRISAGKSAPRPRRAILLTARTFFRRGREAGEPDSRAKTLHRLRISAKKLRYTLELAPAVPAKQRAAIEQVQSDLGRIHDLEAVRKMLRDYRGSKPLRAVLREKQREFTLEFRKFWSAEFGGEKNRRVWMQSIAAFAARFHA